VKDIIRTLHGRDQTTGIADIAEVELYWRCAERIPHVVLLLLVAAEDADFADACAQVSPKYGITERTGAACDD
jgi:hypothetical protein